MEIIFISTVSILVITGVVWLLNKVSPWYICPICAGVSGTWLWMLVGVLTDNLQQTTYNPFIAILMGGSVVGIAYQVEKRLPAFRSALLWKMLFIPTGFIIVESVLLRVWNLALAALILAVILAVIFLFPNRQSSSSDRNVKVEVLEEKMKNCC